MNDELNIKDFSDKTILVCDDEDAYRKFLFKIIEKYLKSKVLVAADPSEMFELLNSEKVDLILLDLQMPVMDGLTALSHIRNNQTTTNIPVLICSALGFENIIFNLARLKINGFIIKPFEAKTVLNKIYDVLINLK